LADTIKDECLGVFTLGFSIPL